MKTIWKYDFDLNANLVVPRLPITARVVLVAQQSGKALPTVWFELDTEHATAGERRFAVYGTGHEIDKRWEHRGSAVCGVFVWHVYEYVPF